MRYLYIILLSAIGLSACEEVPPLINYEKGTKLKDTTYVESQAPAPQLKGVFLEDISGVKCVNCPDASIIAKSILTAFPGRAYAVVMHPDVQSLSAFVSPINKDGYKSKYDFRTKDASSILNLVGMPNSLPRGYVNRRLFGGASSRILGREEWFARCQDELQGTTPVNIDLANSFNAATGKGKLSITLKYTQAVAKKHLLSIMLVEDSIIDVQEYQDQQTIEVKFDPNYVHMHILRDLVTFATGDPLTDDANVTLTPGRVFVKEYEYTMDVSELIKVKPDHAKLIVFVHEDETTMNIVHVKEIEVKE